MNNRFTLIDLMIAVTIVAILASIALPLFTENGDKKSGTRINGNVVLYDFNGRVEIRCIDGFRFIVDPNGARQVMDEYGHGVRCGN